MMGKSIRQIWVKTFNLWKSQLGTKLNLEKNGFKNCHIECLDVLELSELSFTCVADTIYLKYYEGCRNFSKKVPKP